MRVTGTCALPIARRVKVRVTSRSIIAAADELIGSIRCIQIPAKRHRRRTAPYRPVILLGWRAETVSASSLRRKGHPGAAIIRLARVSV